MRTLIVVLLMSLSFSFWGCTANKAEERQSGSTIMTNVDFDETVKLVDTTSVLEQSEELLYNQAFLSIYRYSDPYCLDALNFIGDRDNTEKQKIIVLLAMQQLSQDRFAWFLEGLYLLYQKGRVSEYYVSEYVMPPRAFVGGARKKIRDTHLIKLVQRISQDSSISAMTRELLNGVVKRRGVSR